jgi:opacity protein-like surface antigen
MSIARLLASAAAFALPGAAQEPEPMPPARLHAGAALAIAQPRGEFSEYVDVGGGVEAFFRVGLDPQGVVSLRIRAGFLTYGNETKRVCLSETIGCRIQVDLTTSNNIFLVGLGPELAVPIGRTRLYANGSVGYDYFSTDSNVEGTSSEEPFASTRNFGDGGFSWNGGGGIEVEIARTRQVDVALDFGVAYQGNGRREYLTRGGIIDLPDGSLEFDVKRSEANFVLWRVGVALGIRPEDDG